MSRRFDFIVGCIFLVIGILFVMGSRNLAGAVYGSSITSGTFPLVCGSALIGLSILLLVETFKKHAITSQKSQPLFFKRFSIIAVSCLAYVLLLDTFGYVLVTFVFLMVCFQAMERGKMLNSILIASGFSLGIYLLFVIVLKGSLPAWPNFI